MRKTNAIRILELLKIQFITSSYEVNENDLSAVTVARNIGAAEEQVYKTLIARGEKTGISVFIIPGNEELNLKKAASVSGNKKVEMIKQKEILPLTGYIKGGCSPIGMKKLYPTFIDETALLFDTIFISAGVRGMQIRISPDDLILIVKGIYAEIT